MAIQFDNKTMKIILERQLLRLGAHKNFNVFVTKGEKARVEKDNDKIVIYYDNKITIKELVDSFTSAIA